VKVITIERTFQPPSLTRVAAATVKESAVWGERRPSYWVIDGRGNAAATAVNRLIAAGALPSWTTTGIDGSGYRYAPGSIVVPFVQSAETAVAAIGRELGLRARGMKGRLPDNVRPIGRARVAIYKPWTANIDEGWTRPGARPARVQVREPHRWASALRQPARAVRRRRAAQCAGRPAHLWHVEGRGVREYAGGLGAAGVDAIRAFVQAGGTLVCLGQSSGLAIGAFELPLRDTAQRDDRLFVPGSILRLELDPAEPIAFGMPPSTAAFFAFSSVFTSGSTGGDGTSAALPWAPACASSAATARTTCC